MSFREPRASTLSSRSLGRAIRVGSIAVLPMLGVLSGSATSQTLTASGTPPTPSVSGEAQTTSGHQAGAQPVESEYPTLHITGFGDLNYATNVTRESNSGFSEGQFVLHFASALSPRVTFFGELSFTARSDAGTGMPAATGFNAEVERSIIRFDRNDQLKVSFGRYHTPVNWWNTAFHHGQWLQTTIARPEMTQFGGRFIPVHFVGALVEGALPAGGWNVNYKAGVGNGRGNVISRGGDAADNNRNRAWVIEVFTRPDRAFRLQAGGSLYFDRITQTSGREFRERIVAGHVVWLKEDPEVIAEVAAVRHREIGQTRTTSSPAYYIQTAYRLPWFGRQWKPYYRFEHIHIAAADDVFRGVVSNLDGSILGVRYDLTLYAAVKGELRVLRRSSGQPRSHGGFFQVCFTF